MVESSAKDEESYKPEPIKDGTVIISPSEKQEVTAKADVGESSAKDKLEEKSDMAKCEMGDSSSSKPEKILSEDSAKSELDEGSLSNLEEKSEEATKSMATEDSSSDPQKTSEETPKSETDEGSSSKQEKSTEETAKTDVGESSAEDELSNKREPTKEEEAAESETSEGSSSKPEKSSEVIAKAGVGESSAREQQSHKPEPTKEDAVKSVTGEGSSSKQQKSSDWHVGYLNVLNPSVNESSDSSDDEEDSAGKDTDDGINVIHLPEITLGTVLKFAKHNVPCECGECHKDGLYIETCYTIDDFPEINRAKMMGPDGVCAKMLGRDEQGLMLYVRCDMPGQSPELFNLKGGERMIVAFGMPGSDEYYKDGGRTYWFIIQNHCPCCTFKEGDYEFRYGVFRLRCRISTNPDADAANQKK